MFCLYGYSLASFLFFIVYHKSPHKNSSTCTNSIYVPPSFFLM